jgi:hypothetical protein
MIKGSEVRHADFPIEPMLLRISKLGKLVANSVT